MPRINAACWAINTHDAMQDRIKELESIVTKAVEQAAAEINNQIKPYNPTLIYQAGIDVLANTTPATQDDDLNTNSADISTQVVEEQE